MGKDHKDEYNFGDYEDAYADYEPEVPGFVPQKEENNTWDDITYENTDWSAFD